MPTNLAIIGDMNLNKTKLAIGLIWLFQLSATIGILLGQADWFLSKTPYTLFLYSLLCLWIFPFENATFRYKALSLILLGFISEWIGINHLSIFGEYHYGKNFGFQIDGTPLIIGFNWMVLALVSKSVVSRSLSNKAVAVITAAVLMVLLDIAMEFVAHQFSFWHFKGGMPPLRNYVSWFVIGLIMQLIIANANLKAQYRFSLHYYVVNLLFFGFFAVYYLAN